MRDDVQVIEIIDNEDTGGATFVLEVSKDLLTSVFSQWLTNAVTEHAKEVLSVFEPPALPNENGPPSYTDQGSQETTGSGDMGDPRDWGQSFSYPHER